VPCGARGPNRDRIYPQTREWRPSAGHLLRRVGKALHAREEQVGVGDIRAGQQRIARDIGGPAQRAL
jgi:hypothetical protein